MSLAGCAAGATSSAVGPSITPAPASAKPCATGSIHLIGSTAFTPIAQAAATAYMHECPGAAINVTGGDSAYGVGQVRQAVASGSSAAVSMIGMYDGTSTEATGLSPHPAGVLIYSVVAHSGLFPASNITADELSKIFIKPGEQGKVAVGRRAGSGSREAFDENVLRSNPGIPDKGNCPAPTGKAVSFTSCTEDSTADLLKFVNGTPNAIGYAEVPGSNSGYSHLSVLSIGGVAPTPANVANGTYNYWIVEHLYTGPQPTALARDFLSFLTTYSGPDLPSDFVPCSAAVKVLGAAC